MIDLEKIKQFNDTYRSILDIKLPNVQDIIKKQNDIKYTAAVFHVSNGMKVKDAMNEVNLTNGVLKKMDKGSIYYTAKMNSTHKNKNKGKKLVKDHKGNCNYIPLEEFEKLKLNGKLEVKEKTNPKKYKDIKGGAILKSNDDSLNKSRDNVNYALNRLKNQV